MKQLSKNMHIFFLKGDGLQSGLEICTKYNHVKAS